VMGCELALAQPEVVLGLGASVADALQSSGVDCICLPHPAARIGNVASHEPVCRERVPLGLRAIAPVHTRILS
jgi:hypothetical protein